MTGKLKIYKDRLLSSTLFKDSAWSLVGNILGKGLSLIGGIVVARLLGKDVYGEYGMIKSTLMNIAIFSTFGLGFSATKFIAESKRTNPENINRIISYVTSVTLIVSSFLALLVFIFSRQIAVYLDAGHLSVTFKIFSAVIIFNALTTVQIGSLAGFNEFKAIARNNIITGVVTFITTIIFTYLWNIEGALIALLISNSVNCILNYVVSQRHRKLYPPISASSGLSLKKILGFSFPIALQEGLYALFGWAFLLLLIRLSTYGEVGLYSAAHQWSSIILFIPGTLRNVALSHLSGSNDDKERHLKTFKRLILISVFPALVCCFMVFVFSDLISNFYGSSFSSLKMVLNISVFTSVFSCIINVYSQEFVSLGRNWIMLFVRLIRDFGTILLSYYLILHPPYSMNENIGGAYWLTLSYLIMSLITVIILYLVHKRLSQLIIPK